jgi:Rod binding domain-containing protein
MIPTSLQAGGTQTPARLREAAEALEAQFLAQLLAPAFSAADSSRSPFGGGAAERQWQPMLTEAFAQQAVRSGRALGLAEIVLRQAQLRLQETRMETQRP